ncbi:ATP-binding protein [Halobacteriovorax sp.]|uniref:sensor histidine kinase n=1 Tax=Halobacteriovorax sp. TaxID=2020862 RepID=UPI0035613D9C
MKLKQLYIFLTFISIAILLGGITFIHLDGQKTISRDKKASLEELDRGLSLLKIISNFRSFTQSSFQDLNHLESEYKKYQSLQKKTNEEIEGYSSVDLGSFDEYAENLFNLNKKKLKLEGKVNVHLSKSLSEWNNIEKELSKQILSQLKGGQEFLPKFKNTLSKWGESIPLLKTLKKSIDVAYVDQENFLELKELMTFSSWLEDWKSKTQESKAPISRLSSEIKEAVSNLKVLKSFKYDFSLRVEKYLEAIEEARRYKSLVRTVEKDITKYKKIATNFLTQELIPKLQDQTSLKLDQTILSRSKRHQTIVQIATVMGIFIILVMSFLFLNIFPFLNILERKAKLVGKGDFLTKIDKKIPNNEIGKVMNAFNDMTLELSKYLEKIKDHEQEKMQLTDAIQRMRRVNELGEFSAKMAHELKNPLSILTFCLNDALEANKVGDLKANKVELEKSLQALERLNVISGKLGAKALFTSSEKLDVNIIIKELINMYGSLTSKEGVSIEVLERNSKKFINAPRLELMGAIANLLDNAIEYMKSHESVDRDIKVSIDNDSLNIIIEVASSGEEIDNPNKLFNSFYSSKKSITRGMGLVIVKDVIERVDGEISYRYESGYNRFKIEIPIA